MKMLLAVVLLLCAFQNATAAFIDSGSFLTDTVSELDWLDVTASVNRSYNDVSGQFGVDGDFAGWRFATDTEFGTLVGSWLGSVSVGYEKVFIPRDAAAELVTILGNTYDSYFQNTFGVTFSEFMGSPPPRKTVHHTGSCHRQNTLPSSV